LINATKLKSIYLILSVLLMAHSAQALQPSVLSEGLWLKFSVESNGVYKIDYNQLRANGLNPDKVDPRNLQLFTSATGMLPQSLAKPRPVDLQEVAIEVQGEDDGVFNRQDAIYFFGQGPDKFFYHPEKHIVAYENNLYSDKNYYFLRAGSVAGKRITPQASVSPQPQMALVTNYVDFGYYENDTYNELKSGREWFGEVFDSRTELTIRFNMPGIVPGTDVKVASGVMAQTFSPSSFKLLWNNTPVLERKMEVIPNTQYGIKGQVGIDTVVVSASALAATGTATQDLTYQYIKAASGRSVGYLNYLLLQAVRTLAWSGNTAAWIIPPQKSNVALLNVALPGEVRVWNTTVPHQVHEEQVSRSGPTPGFVLAAAQTNYLIAFEPAKVPTAAFEEMVNNQNLRQAAAPDLLIITHPDFQHEASRLAAHRQKQYGINVLVATVNQIFNEYSGGRQDVTALRDFARDLFARTPGKLKNILLFGRGSYDYKNRVFNNSNYVPTYESRNSLAPLETYSSDDYFGFLEPHEGEWGESPTVPHTLDVGVGRLPVRHAAEAADVVNKLIAYDTDPQRAGHWRQSILFVADDGDFNIHQSQADQLAEFIEFNHPEMHTHKLLLDAFEQEERPSGQVSSKASKALNEALAQGYRIVNFTGHGSEQVWMQERILDQSTPGLLTNTPQLPLFVTATCEFGRHDDPLLISTAELLLLRKRGGAIGLVTTARPVNSSTNFTLNKAFYNAYFEDVASPKDLGTLFKETKNNSLSGVANRNFSLLADPSLRLGHATPRVQFDQVKTITGSDTLKAQSTVRIQGIITANGQKLSSNGNVFITLYDKPSNLITKGDENPPFAYRQWQRALFRGSASVINGEFAAEFRLPHNLQTSVGFGKLTAYAMMTNGIEAFGGTPAVKIGATEKNPLADSAGPLVELFMSDTTFAEGGITNASTKLVGRLYDRSGINITGIAPTSLTATLDEQEVFDLSGFFQASIDDFTRGTFTFPLNNLSEGRHTIVVRAWDNAGNSSTGTITFTVGKEGELLIGEVGGYPNPFSNSTALQFTHSRSGDDLQVQVAIYQVTGQPVLTRDFTVVNSAYQVNLFEWDGTGQNGTKMPSGLYVAKVSVRSTDDGAKNEKFTKLILVN